MVKSQASVTGDATKTSAASGNGKTRKINKTKTSAEKTCGALDDLFEKELRGIYSAEKQLIEALPVMAKAAYNEDLQDTFNDHLQETKRHAERLEKIFDRLHIKKSKEETCETIEGLISKSKKIIDEFEEGAVRDSALIISAQKVEHYEIASYGSLCELAEVLGYSKIVELLDRTLEEEEAADKNLTAIAQDVNDEAFEMEHEEVM